MAGGVVIFAPNWLGDAVMALPAIQAIRDGSPDTPLTVAARPAVAPLFDLFRQSAVLRLEARRAGLEAVRAKQFRTAILLPNSFNAARLARQAGIPERWGYASDFRSLLLTRAIPREPRLHQMESYRRLAHRLGFPDGDPTPRLELDASLRDEGRARLQSEGWNGEQPFIAIAPGAAFGTAKRWPAPYFAALVERYAGRGVATVMVGSAGDAGAGHEVAAATQVSVASPQPPASTSSPLINLIGRTDLRMLAAVLVQARMLVSNDSGAMHFAAALGVKVTAMVGPTIEQESHPVGRAHTAVLTSSVWCRPCMLRECPLTHRCMREITVDRVYAATEAHV